ncbi:hypothetical protein KW842_23325 [Duganella sp. sic0402]|uniref:hypothetical protein n=1 Tax=Duganella sp. sic0402 TaxID=2854786 RepID=UPI001C4410F0|nr:hypothetical protein [Duganella sp. sic0402]MBV7538710.1 hypothetical protein [Duganella sp. sic0402]
MTKGIEKHFTALWKRAQQASYLDSLTADELRVWATQRGLRVETLEERNVGLFSPTRCLVLCVEGHKGCIPLVSSSGDPDWKLRREWADRKAALWDKMEWFSPLWIPNGEVSKILKDAEGGDRKRAIELFNYHTSTLYTLAFQAVCIAQFFPKSRCLRDFEPLAREAYLAFYSGYRAASIASLIPAIEGAIDRIIADDRSDIQIPHKVNHAVERAIDRAIGQHYEGNWMPPEYLTREYLFALDERVYCLETFRRWLNNHFFRRIPEYEGVTWLNRHMFAHAGSSEWQQSSNFVRLIIALATLGVVDSWHHGSYDIPLMFPAMNDDSKLLHQQAIIRAQAQSVVIQLEEKNFHDNGRRVPVLPTDDGVTLRLARLTEDCMTDLVRPLRDAGWQVEVGIPQEDGEFMSVTAIDGDERIQVGFLYSCATDCSFAR